MTQEITIPVGELYAELDAQFRDEIGPAYEKRLREEFEDFLHSFNKRVEREREQQRQTQSIETPQTDDE